MQQKRTWWIGAALIALALFVASPAAWGIKLDEAEIFFEINDTDGDAGIQIFLDGEGWDKMKVTSPDGKKQLDVRAKKGIGQQGITELFFESAEPSFEEQSLEELLALFPEGEYKFKGKTTEGKKLTGTATLTHALPDAAVQVSPIDGEATDSGSTVLKWMPVADPPGSEIVMYQVVCETDDDDVPLRIFRADMPPTANKVKVPKQFLEGGGDFKWEILAIEESGNATISESEFEVE